VGLPGRSDDVVSFERKLDVVKFLELVQIEHGHHLLPLKLLEDCSCLRRWWLGHELLLGWMVLDLDVECFGDVLGLDVLDSFVEHFHLNLRQIYCYLLHFHRDYLDRMDFH
jgi:hypothetical protein